jgi:NAD(P)-dependent dehydrogenase (short-subunit alcohol dehydrogenase family)
MEVAIAGAHGQIALRLVHLLAANGDRVTGLIRNPDHATEVSRAGAAPVLCDLERASVEEIATAIEAQTPWSSPLAPDPVAGPLASWRWIATGRSSCCMPRRPPTSRATS